MSTVITAALRGWWIGSSYGEGGQVQSCGITEANEERTLEPAMAEYRKVV
jgi:hypothetical protein